MVKMIKVALAGAGAFGIKHLDGIKNIDGVEVISLVGRELDATRQVATAYGIPHVATDLADSLAIGEVDAVILCTPTQLHAAQASACSRERSLSSWVQLDCVANRFSCCQGTLLIGACWCEQTWRRSWPKTKN